MSAAFWIKSTGAWESYTTVTKIFVGQYAKQTR